MANPQGYIVLEGSESRLARETAQVRDAICVLRELGPNVSQSLQQAVNGDGTYAILSGFLGFPNTEQGWANAGAVKDMIVNAVADAVASSHFTDVSQKIR